MWQGKTRILMVGIWTSNEPAVHPTMQPEHNDPWLLIDIVLYFFSLSNNTQIKKQ
jgi:hypothetical protein